MVAELRKKAAVGASWMVGMRFTVNMLGLCSTVILVRLLTPEDFGLVAIAGSAYTFFAILGQFGFDTALVRIKDPDHAHYDTAWTSNIIIGLIVGMITAALAGPVSVFFRDPRLEYIIYCFAFLSCAKGFENIGVVNFRKNLAFKGEFFLFVLPKLASLITGVIATFILRSYWGLVIAMACSQLTSLLYSHFSQPFRPRFAFSKFADLFAFSRWIVGKNFLEYLATKGLNLIVGRMAGASAVGIYTLATQIAFLPSTEILAPVNRALYPSFSKIADDPPRLRSAAYRVYSLTTFIGIPSAFGIYAISDVLVRVAFGEAWLEVATLLSVLGFIGAINAARTLAQPILFARGVPKYYTLSMVVYVLFLLPGTVFLIGEMGVIGITYAALTAAIATMPILYVGVKREIGIKLSELARYLWRPLLAAGTMAYVVKDVESWLLPGDLEPTVVSLLTLIGVGAVSYAGMILLLWMLSSRPEGPERIISEFLKKNLLPKLQRAA